MLWNIVKLPSSPPTTIRRGLGSAVMMRSVGCGVRGTSLVSGHNAMIQYEALVLGGRGSNSVLYCTVIKKEVQSGQKRGESLTSSLCGCNADFEQRCPACLSKQLFKPGCLEMAIRKLSGAKTSWGISTRKPPAELPFIKQRDFRIDFSCMKHL